MEVWANYYSIFIAVKTRTLALLCTLVLLHSIVSAQIAPRSLKADSLNKYPNGISLIKQDWMFHAGDVLKWKEPSFNDLEWQTVKPNFGTDNLLRGWKGIGWFRLWITVDPNLQHDILALKINHDGASEIYLDGQQIGGFGKIGPSQLLMKPERPPFKLVPFVIGDAKPHLIAIRYSNYKAAFPDFIGFEIQVARYQHLSEVLLSRIQRNSFMLVSAGAQMSLVLLHLFLFVSYPRQKQNLYYSVLILLSSLSLYLRFIVIGTSDPFTQRLADTLFGYILIMGSFFTGLLLYAVSYTVIPRRRVIILAIAGLLVLIIYYLKSFRLVTEYLAYRSITIYFLLAALDGFRALSVAIYKRKPGVWIVGIGMSILAFFFLVVGSDVLGVMGGDGESIDNWMSLGLLALPICFSIYLALDFARTNYNLSSRLTQVEQLSAQNLAQEAEKLKLITEQAEKLEKTVLERTREVQSKANQLREMDVVKSRFMVNLTHEFRTPLSLILGPAQQLENDAEKGQIRYQASLIRQNATQLLNLINQLLDLSKLESGKMEITNERVDIIQLIEKTLLSFRSMAEQKEIAFNFESSHQQLWGIADSSKVLMIIQNLISNALKFSNSNGRVSITLNLNNQMERPAVELTIADTGIGIADHKLPFIFDRFYQVDASDTRSREGSGIGLALTKELVSLLGGTISITSKEGEGTLAKVTLPFNIVEPYENAAAIQLPEVKAEHTTHATEIPGKTTKLDDAPLVLVIEDHLQLSQFIRTSIGQQFNTIAAENGSEGINLAITQIPDLIITDLMMPGMDGYEVCNAIKNQEQTSHIPVIMLTAKAGSESKITGWKSGADAYITKPFDHKELLALIENLLTTRRRLAERYGKDPLWQGENIDMPSQEKVFINKVRQIVEQQLSNEQFSVEMLGDQIGLSRTQLHRKLKGSINQTPGDLIRIVRLQRAFKLLSSNAGNVAEVAYMVGFGNPASFSTSFSRHFGYAPSEVKKE